MEGTLEVKLPTIWTDEKDMFQGNLKGQEMGFARNNA